MRLKAGQLLCVERKRKNRKKNKWERWSRIYIYLKNNKAMGFRGGEPIVIDIEDENKKGNRIEKVITNIGDVLNEHWKVDFDTFFKAFSNRI